MWEIVEKERDVNVNSIEGYEELETNLDFHDAASSMPIMENGQRSSKTCVIN